MTPRRLADLNAHFKPNTVVPAIDPALSAARCAIAAPAPHRQAASWLTAVYFPGAAIRQRPAGNRPLPGARARIDATRLGARDGKAARRGAKRSRADLRGSCHHASVGRGPARAGVAGLPRLAPHAAGMRPGPLQRPKARLLFLLYNSSRWVRGLKPVDNRAGQMLCLAGNAAARRRERRTLPNE